MDKIRRNVKIRNLCGFWFLGLCNNFVYGVMLSAAEDIINRNEGSTKNTTDANCEETITERHCDAMSTGAILLADNLPTVLIKLTFPFFYHRMPYGIRHLAVVIAQATGLLTVAFSKTIEISILGVLFTSFGSGLGEITYLSLSSHFDGHSVAAFASGTGMAGISSALAYAALTEPHLAHLSPQTTLLIMLIMPVIFAAAYWRLMVMPDTVAKVNCTKSRTFSVVDHQEKWEIKASTAEKINFTHRLRLVLPLLRFMIPLFAVYYGEYLINQGIVSYHIQANHHRFLVQLIVFPCSSGWHLSPASQYRWFQVLYQLGVFVSRSSVFFFQIPPLVLPIFAVLQLCNMCFALTEALYSYVPHIGMIFTVILYEGLLGGLTYANSFHAIHAMVPLKHREFSLSVASLADSSGTIAAALSAIPLHNWICQQSLRR